MLHISLRLMPAAADNGRRATQPVGQCQPKAMANDAATTCVSIFHLIGRQAEAKRLLLARRERIVMFRCPSRRRVPGQRCRFKMSVSSCFLGGRRPGNEWPCRPHQRPHSIFPPAPSNYKDIQTAVVRQPAMRPGALKQKTPTCHRGAINSSIQTAQERRQKKVFIESD